MGEFYKIKEYHESWPGDGCIIRLHVVMFGVNDTFVVTRVKEYTDNWSKHMVTAECSDIYSSIYRDKVEQVYVTWCDHNCL